ncbi:MAG TPA: nuclear transport factor 2 family protein [Solirubrobacterales bacterium]|jgi:hypothetical protein
MEAAQATRGKGIEIGPDIETLMEIERELADGDGAVYLRRLCDDAVVVLPGRVLDKAATAAVMGDAPSWDGHEFRNGRIRVLDEDTAILTYRFEGRRGYERYDAVLSSTYVRERGGEWELAFHQQTPLP